MYVHWIPLNFTLLLLLFWMITDFLNPKINRHFDVTLEWDRFWHFYSFEYFLPSIIRPACFLLKRMIFSSWWWLQTDILTKNKEMSWLKRPSDWKMADHNTWNLETYQISVIAMINAQRSYPTLSAGFPRKLIDICFLLCVKAYDITFHTSKKAQFFTSFYKGNLQKRTNASYHG